jgi:hypothetical protein
MRSSFRFRPELLADTVQHYYRVCHLYNGLSTTILSWSYSQHAPRRTFLVAVTTITPAQREDSAWRARDHPTGAVHLNRQMGLELAAMLESYGLLIDP